MGYSQSTSTNMGTVSKLGLKFWSFLDFLARFYPHAPLKLFKKEYTIGNIKVDVWEEKCDISFKDRYI